MITQTVSPIIQTAPMPTLSNAYSYVSTEAVITRLVGLGYSVTQHSIVKPRNPDRQGYQKHLVRLTRADLYTPDAGLRPEVIIQNSHDGSSSLEFALGLFRLVCANGLRVGTTVDAVRVRHVGDVMPKIDRAIESLVTKTDSVWDLIETARTKTVTPADKIMLARSAAAVVLPGVSFELIDTETLLRPRRGEDNSNDLFTIFNRLQENIIRGGIKYIHVNPETNTLRRVSTRSVKSLTRDQSINAQLWNILAEAVSNV